MRIVFAEIELAREGDGFTDVISVSPLTRNASPDKIELIGSPPVFKNPTNATYSIKATVPYFCDSQELAIQKISEMGKILDAIEEGDALIEMESSSVQLANASVIANFPDETVDGFFEVEFVFEGELIYEQTI